MKLFYIPYVSSTLKNCVSPRFGAEPSRREFIESLWILSKGSMVIESRSPLFLTLTFFDQTADVTSDAERNEWQFVFKNRQGITYRLAYNVKEQTLVLKDKEDKIIEGDPGEIKTWRSLFRNFESRLQTDKIQAQLKQILQQLDQDPSILKKIRGHKVILPYPDLQYCFSFTPATGQLEVQSNSSQRLLYTLTFITDKQLLRLDKYFPKISHESNEKAEIELWQALMHKLGSIPRNLEVDPEEPEVTLPEEKSFNPAEHSKAIENHLNQLSRFSEAEWQDMKADKVLGLKTLGTDEDIQKLYQKLSQQIFMSQTLDLEKKLQIQKQLHKAYVVLFHRGYLLGLDEKSVMRLDAFQALGCFKGMPNKVYKDAYRNLATLLHQDRNNTLMRGIIQKGKQTVYNRVFAKITEAYNQLTKTVSASS